MARLLHTQSQGQLPRQFAIVLASSPYAARLSAVKEPGLGWLGPGPAARCAFARDVLSRSMRAHAPATVDTSLCDVGHGARGLDYQMKSRKENSRTAQKNSCGKFFAQIDSSVRSRNAHPLFIGRCQKHGAGIF